MGTRGKSKKNHPPYSPTNYLQIYIYILGFHNIYIYYTLKGARGTRGCTKNKSPLYHLTRLVSYKTLSILLNKMPKSDGYSSSSIMFTFRDFML
jgi:hypothetical protein